MIRPWLARHLLRFMVTLLITASVFNSTALAQLPIAFDRRCSVCHQASGSGIPGIYPPIAGTIGGYVKLPQGRTFLIHLLLNGMNGPISSRGTTYDGFMPMAADFSDGDLAAAINYVLEKLNAQQLPANFRPLTVAEFKLARSTPIGPRDVWKEREKLIAALGKSGKASGQ